MLGELLTEDELEKYFVYGVCPSTTPSRVAPPSSAYNSQHGVGEPSSVVSRYSTASPSHDRSEVQPLSSGSSTRSSNRSTILDSDALSDANIWTRMVSRPSLKRSRRLICYDMQQDVLNVVRSDHGSSSVESTTVVETDSASTPESLGPSLDNKLPDTTMVSEEKATRSGKSDSTSTLRSEAEENKGKGLKNHACLLPNLRMKIAWKRLRRWTATALVQMKSAARLPSATRPISQWSFPQRMTIEDGRT